MAISDPVAKYARAVVSGKIVAGPYVRAQCARHLRDLELGAARGIRFDKEAALRAINFFPDILRLSDGQFDGIKFHLQPAQAFIVGSLFGWKRADETRRFRRAYIEMGKGNGKSPLCAGIGLYGMMADGEPGAQIFAAASKMEQARILFDDAVKMVRQSPRLEERITPTGFNPVNNLADLKTGSYFKPLGRDTGKTGSGLRPHFALIDELHEHPNRDALDLLERGFKFRRQPLLMMITNSGSDLNSICWEEHELAVKVATGEEENDALFTYVCAMDEGDDPLEDPSCRIKANPLLGTILTETYLEEVARQARQSPGKANGIKRLHFCIWTDAETAWISRELWQECEDPTLELEAFDGQDCWIGLDLGATRDLVGCSTIFADGFTDPAEDPETGETLPPQPKFVLFAHGFTPKGTIEQRAKEDRANYPLWAEQGHITATPGKVIRLDMVADYLVQLSARFSIAAVAYDRWLIRNLETTLDEMNVTLPLIEHPQSIARRKDSPLWMPESIDTFEQLLLEKRLRIAVNPALRSAVAGATFWTSPAGLRRFEKSSAKRRIDMAVSSAMAIGGATSGTVTDQGVDMDDVLSNVVTQ